MAEIIFGLESYQSRSPLVSSQRMVNAFFERQPQGATGQTPIFGTPGLSLFTSLPAGPVRQMWPFQGQLYAVAAQSLYRINNNGGYKLLGEGIAGENICSMSDNGQQVMTVNGTSGYIVDNEDNFSQIQDPNFYSASTVQYFDDYFVFDRAGTNEYFLSPLGTGLPPYNGLQFASAVAQPGFLLATVENLQLLFLMCQNHIEMWYDAGTSPFPFQRYAGGVIEYGCAGALSNVKQDGAVFFLGSDKVFYRLQGNLPSRVSNHGIEYMIDQWARIDDAFCFTYTWQGHKMVHLTSPSASQSLVFDVSTQMWHERESFNAKGQSIQRWTGNCTCEIFNKVMVGDYQSGNIYFMDYSNYTENGNTMPFRVHSSTIKDDKLRTYIGRLELYFETGVAPPTGQGADPFALLRWSKDGSKKWSSIQPPRSTGKQGEFQRRMRWLALGQAYQWNFLLEITDPVKRVLVNTYLDAMPGMR